MVQGFFWVMSEDLGIFLGPEFCLHSIIPVIYKSEYPPWGRDLREKGAGSIREVEGGGQKPGFRRWWESGETEKNFATLCYILN